MSIKNLEKFPVLTSSRFILRELAIEDANDFLRYLTHPSVSKYLSAQDLPRNLEEAKHELQYWSRLFHAKLSIYWGIADIRTNRLIGSCGLNNWSAVHHRAEISYDLDFDYWGQGIMTESLTLVCQFLFSFLEANRIQATVASDNFQSIRVLEKLGFQQEGLLKKYGILHKEAKDFFMYGLVS